MAMRECQLIKGKEATIRAFSGRVSSELPKRVEKKGAGHNSSWFVMLGRTVSGKVTIPCV